METDSQTPKRPPGRPPLRDAGETRSLLIEAAAAEFVAQGFAQASMSRIASRAGISTRTLYKLAAGKEDLFRVVCTQRIADTLAGLPERGSDLHDLVAAYARLVLGPEGRATARILIEEQGRFPDLAASFREISARASQTFETEASALIARLFPARAEPALLARLLRLILIGEQRQQILNLAPPMTDTEITAFTETIIRAVVRGA
ncbi:TetR/AcrR family transcriptional regulator [Paenirhodobacter sp.]|uniref:TetR/AcrR family transcriptional regulator n=1 Tax=Paenirhodobacter sp. TaxID=1965326 RepID=UPI003B3E30F5